MSIKNKRDVNIATKQKNSLDRRLEAYTLKGDNWLEIMLPLITVSEGNGGAKVAYMRNGKKLYKPEHWSDANLRHRRQKGTVALMLRPHRSFLSLPCTIKLTRFAPRQLDTFENLPMSMKYIYDAICEVITGDYRPGRADGNKGFKVSCDQEICSQYGVKIKIEMP